MRASPAKDRFQRMVGCSSGYNGHQGASSASTYQGREEHRKRHVTTNNPPPKSVHKLQLQPLSIGDATVGESRGVEKAGGSKSRLKIVADSPEKCPLMPSLEDISPEGSQEPVPASLLPAGHSDTDTIESPSTFMNTQPSKGIGHK